MRSALTLTAVLLAPALAGAAAPPATPPALIAELHGFYQSGKSPAAWTRATEQLASDDAAARRKASAYLLALAKQSLSDELAGKGWNRNPLDDFPAHVADHRRTVQLRHHIVSAAARAGQKPEVMPLIDWFFAEEPRSNVQEALLAFLNEMSDPKGIRLRRVVRQPHPNAVLLAQALALMAEREVKIPAEELARLGQHHRVEVRKAARNLAKALGQPEPPAFKPVKALASPQMQALLRRVGEELLETPKSDARLVMVKVTEGKGRAQTTRFTRGWQVPENQPVVSRFVVSNGFRREAIPMRPARTRDGSPRKVIVENLRPGVEVRRLQPDMGRDEEEDRSSAYGAALAWWLARTGQSALAARLLFTLLERGQQDDDLLENLRRYVAEECSQRMFEAFANARDYRAALELARRIDRRYPGSVFHAEARRLLDELPRRMDDFVKLKLPTPAEWRVLRKTLTHEEQIDFLCRRLRLLNDPGGSHPSLLDPSQQQFAQPSGLQAGYPYARDPNRPAESSRAEKGRTVVINPLGELKESMKLTLADVPLLARHLREDLLLATVGSIGGIGFGNSRPALNLTTRPLLADIINDLARKPICRLDAEPGDDRPLPKAEIHRRIESAVRWSRAHANDSVAELEWYWLHKERAEGANWHVLRNRLWVLHEQGDPRAMPLLHALLLDGKTSPQDRAGLLGWSVDLDPRRARWFASHFLSARDDALRVRAAVLCLPTAEADRARRVMGEYLREAGRPQTKDRPAVETTWVEEVVAELVADGTPASMAAAKRAFEGAALMQVKGYERGRILRQLADAGVKEAYAFYLPLLRIKPDQLDKDSRKPMAELYANEVRENLANDDRKLQAALRKHPRLADRVPLLEQWLKERIAALEARPRE